MTSDSDSTEATVGNYVEGPFGAPVPEREVEVTLLHDELNLLARAR